MLKVTCNNQVNDKLCEGLSCCPERKGAELSNFLLQHVDCERKTPFHTSSDLRGRFLRETECELLTVTVKSGRGDLKRDTVADDS